jgi:hypothetical protein
MLWELEGEKYEMRPGKGLFRRKQENEAKRGSMFRG